MKSGKVFLGILVGFSAGALMGILFAPEKGIRTRKRIQDKGEDYADAIKDKFDEFLDTIAQKYGSTWQEAEELFSKGKTKFEETKKDFKNEAKKEPNSVML